MKKLILIGFALFCLRNSKAQLIGNYVNNGSFEEYYNCLGSSPDPIQKVKYWMGTDSLSVAGMGFSVCNGQVPVSPEWGAYQYPRSGTSYVYSIFYNKYQIDIIQRTYQKNRLKSTLKAGKVYCVKFYVNISNTSNYGIDGFGAYFGGSEIDAIMYPNSPLGYTITPQVQNPQSNIITDTLNWIPITGTFTATGTEKYLLLGNFLSDDDLNTLMINPLSSGIATNGGIDDVSCIEVGLAAYAGRDTTILIGDSVYVGRDLDFAIDPHCVWYQLPDMTTAIDTISGMWVKPTVTTTYVVRQELECGSVKWDTVVVTVRDFDVGIGELEIKNFKLEIYPNPAREMVNVSLTPALSKGEGVAVVQITDVLGKEIINDELKIKNGKSEIDVATLPKGIYFIKIANAVRKFVKE